MAMLHVIEAYTCSGGLPCNIKWTIEGEEEIGSLALPEFYARNRERLRADGGFEAFWSQDTPDAAPHIILGTKGVVGLDFVCSPGAWGGAADVIHSSLGVWFGNPAWRLIQALSTLIDADEGLRVDDLPALSGQLAGDEPILRAMATRLDLADELRQVKALRFKRDMSPYELAQTLSFAPMLNINGLRSGYLGAGTHTIVPNEARAACDLRLPPGLGVDETVAAIRAHLDRRGFADITLRVDSGYPAARTDVSAPVVQAMIAAYRSLGHEPTVQPVEPSATPYYLYTDVLGIPFVWGGLGSAGGSHGPDEWCSVAGLQALMRSTAAFIREFARDPA
jgi:acetylornithine deacetylase/succinyl-diaminopimelate desuccinylase-like protein